MRTLSNRMDAGILMVHLIFHGKSLCLELRIDFNSILQLGHDKM